MDWSRPVKSEQMATLALRKSSNSPLFITDPHPVSTFQFSLQAFGSCSRGNCTRVVSRGQRNVALTSVSLPISMSSLCLLKQFYSRCTNTEPSKEPFTGLARETMGSRYTFIDKEAHFHFDNKCLWLPVEHPHLVFSLFSPFLSQREQPAKQNGAYNSISPFPPIAGCRADRSDRLACHSLPFILNRREREKQAIFCSLQCYLLLSCSHYNTAMMIENERFRSCQKSHQAFSACALPPCVCACWTKCDTRRNRAFPGLHHN